MPRILCLVIALLALVSGSFPARAQGGDFAPRLIVNGRAITNWEVDQRVRMLTLFRATGDIEAAALEALVDERLQIVAAEKAGLALTDEAVLVGMDEFAARANLSGPEFVAALEKAGVAEQTYRDFIRPGLLWRELVRARFGPRAQISEAEIDRAINATTEQTAVRVLLSELVIPVVPGNESAAMVQVQQLRRRITNEEQFAAAAREFSIAPSAARGGELDWRSLTSLPEDIAPLILGLGTGRVSEPVEVDGAVAMFLLRGIEETGAAAPVGTAVEYALFGIAANRDPAAETARLQAAVDTCDDLYGQARGLPLDQLVRETVPAGGIPANLAGAMNGLDDNESTLVTIGGRPTFLMLCARVPVLDVAPSRDTVRAQLLNRRLVAFAAGYLEELRADAIIREP